MSTKRKIINRTQPPGGGGKIKPEVIATFKRLQAFEQNPNSRIWEQDGGCQREYLDLCVRLDIELLGFEPWNYFAPSEVRGNSAQPKWIREHEVADWQRAIKVRRELERAAAAASC